MQVKKHIAFFLLGIFVFPVFARPAHIVLHHSHEIHDHCCQNKPASAGSNETIVILPVTDHDCQLCEYKFSKNTLPGIPVIVSVIPAIDRSYKEAAKSQLYQQPIETNSSRAPPCRTQIR